MMRQSWKVLPVRERIATNFKKDSIIDMGTVRQYRKQGTRLRSQTQAFGITP